MEKKYKPKPVWGDMPFDMVTKIAHQTPPKPFLVQFHWNGEPLLYPRFGDAIDAFSHCVTAVDTNGKLLVEKANQIIGKLDTLTLSVIERDPEVQEQRRVLEEFLKLKGDAKPQMVYRLLGHVDVREWNMYPGTVVTRLLHDPLGSYGYERPVTIPEHGICLDMLHSIAIDRYGHVCHCVRLDKENMNEAPRSTIGHVDKATLEEIVTGTEIQSWHNHPRIRYVNLHLEGKRDQVPLCKSCEFYGVPTGRDLTAAEKKYGRIAPEGTDYRPERKIRTDARKRAGELV